MTIESMSAGELRCSFGGSEFVFWLSFVSSGIVLIGNSSPVSNYTLILLSVIWSRFPLLASARLCC